MRGPAPVTVTVSDDERQRLDSWAHRSRSAPQVARRARIILACAAGRSTTSIAKRFHVSRTTVCKWRTRFVRDRLEGLIDEPRPGTPRRITDAQVEQVVIATLETTPRGATQWGASGIRVGMSTCLIRVQVQASEMEVDSLAEPLPAPKPCGLFLDPLDA